jgi:hypothetical protein
MSVERGPYQSMLKTDLPSFLAKYLISSKFRYTIGKALTNAIIGDIFVGQAKGPVQKWRIFVWKKAIFRGQYLQE